MRLYAAVLVGTLCAPGAIAAETGAQDAGHSLDVSIAPGTIVQIQAPKTIAIPGVLRASAGWTEWGPGTSPLRERSKGFGAAVEGWKENLRVPEPGGTLRGRFVAIDADGLLLIPDGSRDPVRIPKEAIARLDVRAGKGPRARNALIGGLVGVGLGLAMTIVQAETCERHDDCYGVGYAFYSTPFLGGAGAIVGAALSPRDRWQAPIPASTVRGATGGRGLGVRVSFSF
jgi:hypothetical protein